MHDLKERERKQREGIRKDKIARGSSSNTPSRSRGFDRDSGGSIAFETQNTSVAPRHPDKCLERGGLGEFILGALEEKSQGCAPTCE